MEARGRRDFDEPNDAEVFRLNNPKLAGVTDFASDYAMSHSDTS